MRKRLGKRTLPFVLTLVLLTVLISGCGSSNEGGSSGDDIDVNLSVLSATMLFAEIINIMNSPEDYLGQVIKIHGEYFNFYHEEDNEYIHFVQIFDEMGCCEQGFQFRVNENFGSPEELFEIGEGIEIIGIFQSYEGEGLGRFYLAVEELNAL